MSQQRSRPAAAASAAGGPEQPSALWILLFSTPGAALAALAISAQTYLSMLGHGHSFRAIFLWQLSSWTLWALSAPVVVRAGSALVAGGHRVGRVQVRLAVLATALVALHIAVASGLTVWFQPFVPFMPATYREALAAQTLALLPIDLLTFSLLVLVGWTLAVYYRARWLEVRESRLETDLARANLEALRLEIQPHFLFNTLNAIAALIRRKANDRALDMLVRLSSLMRQTLDRPEEALLPLDAEVAFTRQYVDLQQVRFADRLDVRYHIDEACRDLAVPTFLFQPLVENAIRHGVGGRSEACQIEIGAALAPPGGLHLWITDDGVGLPPGFDLARDAGTGLGNIRSRLHHLFGQTATFAVGPREGGGARVDIRLPASPAARTARESA